MLFDLPAIVPFDEALIPVVAAPATPAVLDEGITVLLA